MGTIAKPLLGFFLLLPVAALSAASCGGNAADNTQAAGGSGVVAGAGGALNQGGAVAAGTSGGGASAGEGGASADGGAGASAGEGGASAGDGGSSPVGVVDKSACVSNSDCTIIPNRCCTCYYGSQLSDYIAINVAYASDYQAQCNAADCPTCIPGFSPSDPIGPVANYVPSCRQLAVPDPSTGGETARGQCVIVDLRVTEITACDVKEDCALRGGTQCCPGCGGSPISINKSKEPDLETLLCDATPAACSACTPTFPGYIVNCSAGRCGATFPE